MLSCISFCGRRCALIQLNRCVPRLTKISARRGNSLRDKAANEKTDGFAVRFLLRALRALDSRSVSGIQKPSFARLLDTDTQSQCAALALRGCFVHAFARQSSFDRKHGSDRIKEKSCPCGQPFSKRVNIKKRKGMKVSKKETKRRASVGSAV